MNKVRKWLPFTLMITLACLSFIYFILFGDNEPYFPESGDPAIIYQEACVQCHGKNGEGSGILYPAFDHSELTLEIIRQNIKEGTWLMPRFKNINGDTLNLLSDYIYQKKYLK
jgi:cytochrome c553